MVNLVKITAGSQTFRRSSGKLSAFEMKCNGTNQKTLHSKSSFKVSGSPTFISAHKNNINCFGRYISQDFEVTNGSVLCLQAQLSKGGGNYGDAMMMISLREDGPLIAIDFTPLPDRDSAITYVEAFVGRGDILELSELEVYGIELTTTQIRNFFNEEEVEEIFNVKVLAEGSDKPTIKTIKDSHGEVKTIKVPSKTRRKLRLKK